MSRHISSNKREVSKQKEQKRLEKQKKKEARKVSGKGNSFEDMIAYVDENGVITSTPPDMQNKEEIDIDSIEVSVPKKTEDESASIFNGRVEHFNDSKGFGFIKDMGSVNKYFFHISEVEGEIKEGDKVVFELAKGTRGMNAVRIKQRVQESKPESKQVEKK
jgi:cold shock CspA family protein